MTVRRIGLRIDHGWLTRRYTAGLVVLALLACANFLVFWLLLAASGHTQGLLHATTRVTLLSQEAARHARGLEVAEDDAQRQALLDSLATTAARLANAYGELVEVQAAGPDGDRARRLYVSGPTAVRPLVGAFLHDLNRLAATPAELVAPGDPALNRVLAAADIPGPLFAALDDAEAAMRLEAAARAGVLKAGAVGLFAVSLLVLGLVALFVFRPMAEAVEDRMAAAAGLEAELRRARALLEEEVRARTLELRRAKETAEEASLAKSRFLAAAGHDLMQPVKALGLMVTLLERSRAGLGEPLVADLRGAITSATGLLKGLLDFSKVEAGVLRAEPRHLSLQPLIGQLCSEMRLQGGAQGLRFRCVPASLVVDSDPVLLERILRNLLSNALRYTASGRVLLGCRRGGGVVRIEVHDTGPGIPEADLNRVFAAFTRGEVEPDDEALGLGLAIADSMARLLGHRLGVRSRVGHGSVFWVEVPLVAWLPRRMLGIPAVRTG